MIVGHCKICYKYEWQILLPNYPLQFMKIIPQVVLCLSLFASLGPSRPVSAQFGNSQTAEQILIKMADRYSSADSYQDTGFVQITPKTAAVAKPRILNSFRSYFARPGDYRFEWRSNDAADSGWKVIWTTGEFFSTLNSNGIPELEMDRGMMIARTSAVTRGASQTVAALLSGTVRGFRVSSMLEPVLLRQERFEGEKCFVVRGKHPLGFSIDVWIGINDFLIRKIRQTNGDGSFQEEIRRNIKLNNPIPAEIFQYKSKKTAPKNVT